MTIKSQLDACAGCGGPLPSSALGRRPFKWCSERCRKSQYDLKCVDCGVRVSGTDPGSRKGREPRCVACRARELGAERKVWTRETLIAAIRDWADEYGDPPASPDWNPTQARHQFHDESRAARFEAAEGRWPWLQTVIREFGSWNAGLIAAGFDPRPAHGGGENVARRRSQRKAAA